MVNPNDLYWLAGLLEGEGCFWYGTGGRILIRLAMTDEDVIQRAARLMQALVEKPRMPHSRATKVVYACRVRGDAAIRWMELLRPLMGIRRQRKIDDCLAFAATRPGKRYNSCGGRDKPRRGIYGLSHPREVHRINPIAPLIGGPP